MRRVLPVLILGAVLATTAACSSPAPAGSPTSPSAPRSSAASAPLGTLTPVTPAVPRFAHVVIVVEENHGPAAAESMGYLTQLRRTGRTFVDSHGITHPSQPNYLALWSGSTHGVTGDGCPVDLGDAPSLGGQLLDAGRTVAAYAQSIPAAGSAACTAGPYARKHDPLADFAATAGPAHDLPFSAFPSDYDRLPSVALVVPDLDHDAHDGTVAEADDWLRAHLASYAAWAPSHDSLLVVTWDEDEDTSANRILTVFAGAHVQPGTATERIDHVRVLHTIEASFGLPLLGRAAAPITDAWEG